MKKQIENLREQLKKRILAGEYEVLEINRSSTSGYLVGIAIRVDGVEFEYTVGKGLLCDLSNLSFFSSKDKDVINHFLTVYEETFNTEEMKQLEIERLEAKIKELKTN